MFFFFFFSSRRRHTRYWRDWSSDVCSSDLDWRADKPGLVRIIRPEDLPRPGATPSAANVSRVVPRPATAVPRVPAGFKVELLAEGLNGPREMRVAPNGDIFVAETRAGRIRILRLAEAGAKLSTNEIYASGLNKPFGIAF